MKKRYNKLNQFNPPFASRCFFFQNSVVYIDLRIRVHGKNALRKVYIVPL